MNQPFGIFRRGEDYESERVRQEALASGFDVFVAEYLEMKLVITNNGIRFDYQGRSIPTDFRAVYLRPSGVENEPNAAPLRVALVDYLTNRRVPVLNAGILKNYLRFNKVLQLIRLATVGLPIVPSRYYGHADLIAESLPVVAKSIAGSKGAGVDLIKTEPELAAMVGKYHSRKLLFQDVLPPGTDYRVLVLAGRALGVMKRIAPAGKFLSNISQGGRGEAFADVAMSDLGAKTAAAFGADYAGVDLMKDSSGQLKILEVNRFAEFQGFEKATGVNVAREIVSYLSLGSS